MQVGNTKGCTALCADDKQAAVLWAGYLRAPTTRQQATGHKGRQAPSPTRRPLTHRVAEASQGLRVEPTDLLQADDVRLHIGEQGHQAAQLPPNAPTVVGQDTQFASAKLSPLPKTGGQTLERMALQVVAEAQTRSKGAVTDGGRRTWPPIGH